MSTEPEIPTKKIEIEIGDANAFALIHSCLRTLENWIIRNKPSEAEKTVLMEAVNTHGLPVVTLDSIFVPYQKRGAGIGNRLFERIDEKTDHCTLMALIQSAEATQKEGFDLERWYVSKGFGKAAPEENGETPLLIRINS